LTDPNEDLQCSFCGKLQKDVKKLIAGPDVFICDECVDICVNAIDDHNNDSESSFEMDKIPSPENIKEFLDQYVIGQDDAKMTVAVAVYNHYKRITNKSLIDDVEIEKSNILLIGPSAVGKTKIAQTIARYLKVPFAIADATTLTETGYVGEDVESIISRLLQSADMNVEKAQRGIIFIDEIDKLRRKSGGGSRDVSGEGVQQGLLKLLEGSEVMVPASGRRGPQSEMLKVDTKDILFICGGAFSGINDEDTQSIGFGQRKNVQKKAIEPEDLMKYGLIPEFVGRLPVISTLFELTEDELVRVLTEPKNAIVRQFEKLFSLDNVTLTFDVSALRAISKEAKRHKTGARGLRGVIEKTLLKIQYGLPTMAANGIVEILIDEDVIMGRTEAKMVKKLIENNI
jgi:ATP-dependent Clp protease ATP-binding subunit ClpX